jgi:hypothetical protein
MALLQYDFAVVNQNALAQALASNERRIAQHNARVSRLVGTPVARARASTRAGLTDETRAATALDRQRSAALMQLHRAEQRQRLQGERAIQREGMRLDRERTAAAKALDRQRATALFAQHRASERAAAGLARRERADRRAIAGAVTGRIGRSLSNTLSGAGSLAVGALGIGGSIAAGSAISTQISETARASQLANQAGRPEIKGQLLREAQGTKGFTGMEALEGMGAFTDVTGDLDAARAALPELAQLSLATGAALNDLGAAAGNAFIPLADKIKDPQARMKALLTTMRAIAGQGAVGAVEVKDLAIEMAGLAAATNKFSGDPASLIKSVGAMAQAARQRGGAGTAAEAVTSVSRFVSDMAGRPEAFEKAGIKIGTRDKAGALTQLDDPQEIMVRMLQKTGGDLGKISGLFGVYAERAVAGFSPLYAQAEAGNMALPPAERQARGVAGEKAVRAEFGRLLAAELSPEQQAKRAASRLDDPDLKFKEAMKQFNAAIGSELLPVLTRLIPEFTKLLPSLTRAAEIFARFVESAAKDPVGTLFKVIAAKMLLDLGAAGIGAAVRNALMRILGGGGMPAPGGAPGVPVPGGKGGFMGRPTAAGVLGAVGIGTMIGAPIAAAITAEGIGSIDAGEASMKESGHKLDMVRALGGKSSAGEFRAASDAISEQEGKVAELGKTDMFADFMGLFGASNRDVEKKTQESMLTEMRESYAKAVEAAQKQNEASSKLAAAADKIAGSNLNRGNTPAPPVP